MIWVPLLRGQHLIAEDGICVRARALLVVASPEGVATAVSGVLASTPEESGVVLRAVALGKTGWVADVAQSRVLVTLPPSWQYRFWREYTGALVVEKGLGIRVARSVAQLDTRAFYDSVSTLKC